MPTRVSYAIMAVLAALCLLAADRVLVMEHAQHGVLDLDREASVLARDFGRFIGDRTRAVEILAGDPSLLTTTASFERKAEELFGATEDVLVAGLIADDGSFLARWPATAPDITPDGIAGVFVASAESRTPCLRRSPASETAIEAISFAGTSAGRRVFAWGCFGLGPMERRLREMSAYGEFRMALEDEAGAPVIANMTATGSANDRVVPAGADNLKWRVRASPREALWFSLLARRIMLGGVGLIMAAGLGLLYALQARQCDELREENQKLSRLAEQNRLVLDRLIRLNKDLDEFTYVVSHDLKEPLRGVEGVARMFIEECGDELGAAGQEYLRTIRESGARMRRLVDDLLRLSRVTRRRYPHELIDFEDLVRDALDTLAFRIQESGAEILVQPDMPRLMSDRVRLAELYQNLLSNALKFAGDRPPRIEIGHESRPEEEVFWVSDNGIGVNAADRERIFEIFQRAAPAKCEEGSGIGLTICKRIVENLGGRIWMEPAPGGGARFVFTLPREASPIREPETGAVYEYAGAENPAG